MKRIHLWAILAVLLSLIVGAAAQTGTTGRISGVVTDPSGAVLSGAKVELTGGAGIRRETVSNSEGEYGFALVPPGAYTVTITAAGFAKTELKDVAVRLTETTALNIPVKVSGASENVTVSAEAPLLQTAAPTTGRVVDSQTISELPLATRNFTQILSLSTGAATYLPDNTAVGRNSQNISVNGGRVTWNNFQINGIDANSMGTNSAPSVSVPAPETIEEFKVQTSLVDATYGRSAGGNIQAVTKSGTDTLHGTVYHYFRNEALNANDSFLKASNTPKPVLRRNVFGGALGGPIKRDRAYFFGSYQGTWEKNGASRINSLSSGILVDPLLTDNRSAATLQTTYGLASIDPVALALLNAKLPDGKYLIPTPNAAGGRYNGSALSEYKEHQFNSNVDFRISSNNTLSGKFFFSNSPQYLQLPSFLGAGPNVPGYGNKQQNNTRLISIQDTHVFSPTKINEFRAGYNFIRVDATPDEPVLDSAVGITRSNAATFPGLPLIQINPASGGVVIGTSPTIDVKATSPSTTIADTFSWIHGNHTTRFGGEFRYNQNLYTLNFFTRGQMQYLSFNNFLTGRPFVTILGSGNGNRHLKAPDYAFFIQDDWKVTPRLTVNLGLRYELLMPPYDTNGRIATFDPALYQPRPAIGGAVVGPPIAGYVQAGNVTSAFDVASIPNVDKRVVNSIDPNNFAPRIGFAWQPFGDNAKLVMRGGYGVFYSRSSFQYVTLNVIAPPTYVFASQVNFTLAQIAANPFPAVPTQAQFPTLVQGVALSGTFFDRNIRTPFIHQWNSNVQYEIPGGIVMELGYVGSKGQNLFRQVGINQARLVPTGGSITNPVTGLVMTTNLPAQAALRAPYQGVGVSNFFQNQTTGSSSYHSLQTSFSKRMSHGVSFLASYTWAKSIDNASGQGGGAGGSGFVNPGAVGETSGILGNQFDPRANRGVSDFDRKHRFVFSYIWNLPKAKWAQDNAITRVLFNGWGLSGITTWMGGLPVDIVDTQGGNLYGLNGAALTRPNQVSDPMASVPTGYYFNPAAFGRALLGANVPIPSSGGTAVTAGTCSATVPVPAGFVACSDIGNAGRNSVRGPRQFNSDFSIQKTFPTFERQSLEFRADMFNVFNNVNLANPLTDFNAGANFGKIISASNNPRVIQLGLKYTF